MDRHDAVYPGHPITVALLITRTFPSFEAAQAGALQSAEIPGAGGNVHQALDLLVQARGGVPLDEAFRLADRAWATCDGQADGGPAGDHDSRTHFIERWERGQIQADSVKGELRTMLTGWISR